MTKNQRPVLQPKTILPKTYYIKTFGCQMNESDSERIAGFLELQKMKPAKKIEQADIFILNTCGVRQMAEDRAYGQIHNIHVARNMKPETKKPIIILTGCLANRKDVQRRLKDKVDLFCEIKDFQKEMRKKFNSYFLIHTSSEKNCSYLNIKSKYTNAHSAYVPIMTGCNNFCSYCVVPYARGKEVSRPFEDIFKEIENLAKNNYKEITLLGQNVNSYQWTSNVHYGHYGHSMSTTFPKLLQSIAESFPKIKFRFLTSHPKDFSEDLMEVIAKNKNISREIHLPIQAGSNKILRAMNRPYTQKHYLDLIKKARKIIPGVSFTTDVIVGFPGETEKDFQESVKVFKIVKYNEAYINKYSPRPGTVAWKLNDSISWEEKKRREKVLRKFIK
jgi:tRNA-2-methylthio-N6-dimethylallyladenosine synthase